jgi:hypothetical protein
LFSRIQKFLKKKRYIGKLITYIKMNRTKHIAQFESFRGDPRIGTPNPNAGFREGSNDYRNGVICIGDYGGGGLAVGTINSLSEAAYIRELEQFVPTDNVYGDDYTSQIGIDVFEGSDNPGAFVSFSDDQFTLHESGETYKAKEDSFVFTIPNGKFLVLIDGYGQYELLTAKEVKDYFGR